MNLRKLFTTIYSLIIILLIVLVGAVVLKYHYSTTRVQSNIKRAESIAIAGDLKKSSDELTAYCRSYVMTGNSIWEKKYWNVLAIRNGKAQRSNGRTISLQDSMKSLGFTKAELAKLEEAEQNSNNLVWTERVAFNAMKGLFADSTGHFTIKRKPDIAFARRIMFDDKYNYDKSIIMKPINECIQMVMQRTKNEVSEYNKINNILLSAILSLALLISIISIASYILIRNKIILQIEALKQAKEETEKSEKKFRSLIESSPIYITITSFEGDFLECNEAALHFHNVKSIKELQAFNFFQSFTNDSDRKIFKEELQKNRGVRNREIKFKSLVNNTNTDCLVSSNLITLDSGKPAIIYWIIDISEKTEADLLIRKLSTIVSQNPVTIMITDLSGTIEYVNPQFTKNTGYSPEEVIGKNAKVQKSDFHPDDFYKKMWDTITTGNVWKGEFYNKRKDGTYYWENATIAPILDKYDKVINYVAIKQDITQKKEVELALIENEKQLQELNATKDKLFSIIAHDLRGPVANLKSIIDSMITEKGVKHLEILKKILPLLQTSTRSVFDLLEDLLTWARSQQNQVVFKPSSLNLFDISEKNISLLEEIAKNKQITLHDQIPRYTVIQADENMIETIIRNLLMNAIKFTNQGGNVYLSVGEDESSFKIEVKDEGIGMSPEIRKKLFDASENYTSPGTSGEKGTGLGLLICKDFVEKHGGKIWVESTEGKGSKFSFTIPKKPGNQDAS